jgi:hypothetical protein
MPLLLSFTLTVGLGGQAMPLVPAALNVSFPMAYIQSAFVTGHRSGVPCRTKGNINPTLDTTARLEQLRVYASNATSFRGGEMFINTMETPEALADVRLMNELILQVRVECASFWDDGYVGIHSRRSLLPLCGLPTANHLPVTRSKSVSLWDAHALVHKQTSFH